MEYQVKKTKIEMSERKKENYIKLAQVIQWGRKYPVKFVDRFFGIELLDYQKYVFLNSWTTPFCVWCQCRNSGKSTLGSPFIMAKSILVPNFQGYLLAGDGSQSKELFQKIEKIAKKEIASFTGLTDIFYNELVKSVSNSDGFIHNPNSFEYKLFNGSKVNTLNSVANNLRSKRSNCNFYDEAGFIPDELFVATEPFTTQNSDFRLGGDSDVTLSPRQFPNQLIYASSASSVDTYFFKKYREFSKRMFLGDKRYFVADINSDIVMNATFNGKIYPVALITQDKIDNATRENPEKANREYRNIFSKEGGDNQIVKRATVIRNSFVYKPVLFNDTNRRIVMAYDPAHDYDNSIVLIAEEIFNENIGWYLKILNCVCFLDISKRSKKQLRTPEQIDYIKQLLLDYNGSQKADYENIDLLMVDSGAGGGGHIIGDYFMEDWEDKNGIKHRGLIDKEVNEEHVSKFPNAVNKIKLVSPKKYRNEMFSALEEMANLDLIKFTKDYDMKGYIYLDEENQMDEDNDLKQYKLSLDEEVSLKQIDLSKEELVNIYRYENGTSVKYSLPPEKEKKMHDDRAYCLAMLAWRLQQLRRNEIVGKPRKSTLNISDLFGFKAPNIRKV